jgi:Uma2 family endonuclease
MAGTVHRSPTGLLIYEEWLRLPPVEDGTDEVVKGELRFMPPTHYPHPEIVRRLNRMLDRELDEERAIVMDSNFGLMITREPLTCRSPDLVVYRREKIVIQDGLYWTPPDLVIGVLSPSETKGRKEEKLADYASIGVPEAWLVSPEAQSVEIRLLVDGQLKTTDVLLAGELHLTQFPEVSIPVAAIWPD